MKVLSRGRFGGPTYKVKCQTCSCRFEAKESEGQINADRDGTYVLFKCPDCAADVYITRKAQAYP